MSHVVEPRPERSSTISSTETNGVSRLKKLTSGSTWTSPFRSGNSKNLHKQYKEDNAINKVAVPKKFASHPILEESQKSSESKKEDEEAGSQAAESKEEAVGTEKEQATASEEQGEEPIESKEGDEKATNAAEAEESEEKEETEAEVPNEGAPFDDDIEQEVKDTAIELDIDPPSKYEPVVSPDDEQLKEFRDKPVLMGRYQALSAVAATTVASFDSPSKIIDLGSGMKMTQQQLLDIAAKRVAPVLTSINDEVGKTRKEDDIKKKRELDSKVAAHEKKLNSEFDKYVKKLGKKKEKFTKEIESKLEDLGRLITNSHNTAENFDKTTKEEITTANDEFAEREEKAVEKHATDKENLEKNHEELEATKKQELENAKTEQETTSEEIKTLTEKKTQLDSSNAELNTKIEELNVKITEKTALAEDLKTQIGEKETIISGNNEKKDNINKSITSIKNESEEKTSKHAALLAEVGVLSGTLATYTSKINELNNKKKENESRLTDAKSKFENWEIEKKVLAAKVAKEHELKRIEALEAAETQRIEDEIERQRLEREVKLKEEEARLKKEEEEREEAERKEAERIELEKAEAERAEAERLSKDPEYQRKLRLEKQELERKELQDQKAEEERLYNERKTKALEDERKLEVEIEELRAAREEKARNEKLEADKIAEEKLEEIHKLKDEYENKLNFIKERLEFEELQKTRLAEELDNLKKIKSLREEKAKIAEETNKASLAQVQDIIGSRDEEIRLLTKKVAMDDDELFRKLEKKDSFLGISNDFSEPSVKRAISKSDESNVIKSKSGSVKKVTSEEEKVNPKSEHRKSISEVTGSIAHGATAIISGFATSGTAAAIPSASGLKNATTPVLREDPSYKPDVNRSESNTWKRFTKKLRSKKDDHSSSNTLANQDKPSSKKNETVGNKEPPVAADKDSDSEYETYSVYEEVSDGEFEANKDHPDYFEVASHDFEHLISKQK